MTKPEALNQLQELIEDHKNFIGNENQLTDYKKDIEAIEYLISENEKLEKTLNETKDEIREHINKNCDFNGTALYDKWIPGKNILQIIDRVLGDDNIENNRGN